MRVLVVMSNVKGTVMAVMTMVMAVMAMVMVHLCTLMLMTNRMMTGGTYRDHM